MAEVNMKEGKLKDIVDVIRALEALIERANSGELPLDQAKFNLATYKTILQGAGLNLRYMALNKFLAGNMPVARGLPAKPESIPEKPNGSTDKEKPDGASEKDTTN